MPETTQKGWQADGSYVPCPECEWTPPEPDGRLPGRAVRQLGVTHYGDCPTVQFLTPAQKRRLHGHLVEMDRQRRRAAAGASSFWIG